VERVVDVASPDRVHVGVFELLPHHLCMVDLLRMAAFLPNLILAAGFSLVLQCVSFQLSQQCLGVSAFKQVDDPAGREGFRASYRVGNLRGARDQVQVVLKNHVAEQCEVLVLLQVLPRVEDDLHCFVTRENREPADDRPGHEVRILGLAEAVAGT